MKIYIAIKKQIQPGDKIAGRHGNKGVISKICPIEDMPYDSDGKHVDMILNPLSVPSRMNIGQILEVNLGLISKKIGEYISIFLNNNNIYELRIFLKNIYNFGTFFNEFNIDLLSNEEILLLSNIIKNGLPMSSSAFNGVNENEIEKMFDLLNIPKFGKIDLYDGYTGEKLYRKVTVGYMYIMKLNHLVDDKIHSRSTGSYGLITQQPLGGKSQFGGQRFGEMEV
ncbi:hypothetical protein L7J86_00170 [endosymbiont of Metamasius hemipterus]|uniref:DNA-directed RNA polymerase n=1 Tax=endosymbiont of Metamasius hemipterus TaxID=204627 RepID=A0ABT0TXE3_9GAMM|nr:hypothetical protein [Candidatus Nardonella dryophthoridicola]MCM0158232.1 hypothetical protein [endosymbiont of Metamasius hemipterus]